MDGVWVAVDFYHEAIAQAKEKDIESEARRQVRDPQDHLVIR